METEFDVAALPEYLAPDLEHQRRSRERQCRFWHGENISPPPLLLYDVLSEKQQSIPEYDFQQIFTDPAKMLCREVRAACSAANGRSDAVPSIRANLGTGILLSTLGLEQETFPDKMPWLIRHLTKEEISRLSPDDIRPRGSFARGMEMMRYFRDVMGDAVAIYVMDTQGPFDLAHLMLGQELFIQLYDDPPFVHHLMNLCLELGLRTHRWMKEIIDEPIGSLHHSNGLYSDCFGIRICEDTTVMLDREQNETFAMPYSRRLAQAFGGAWVHYCGYNPHLTDAILSYPEFKALNFGHIPGHEQEIDFELNMEKFARAGKVNFNFWPSFPGETVEERLVRLHRHASRGVLFPTWRMDERNATCSGLESGADILAFWQQL